MKSLPPTGVNSALTQVVLPLWVARPVTQVLPTNYSGRTGLARLHEKTIQSVSSIPPSWHRSWSVI